ncbi:hypothetical protein FACS1894202_02650 [Clostridia bacterium]|nr:hypothetical protein FACS1894202_02650 [Clostridia bacterium]
MKRILSFALAAVLSVSLLPFTFHTTALAAETLAPMGFEDGTDMGWANRSSENDPEESRDKTIVTPTDEIPAHSGTYSLKATNRLKNWNGPQLHIEPYIDADTEYDFTIWVHAVSETPSNFRFSVQTGSTGPYNNIDQQEKSAADGWFKMSGSFRFGDNTFATVYVENDFATAEYYIDDFVMVKGGAVAPDYTLPALKDVYKDYFLIGTAVSANDMKGEYFDFIKYHFNTITTGNAMKPESLSKAKDTYDYTEADAIYAAARDAGMLLHGHTLAWHQQSAEWLNAPGTTRAEAETNLKNYITAVATHFKGELTSWDVLNEAIDDGSNSLRTNVNWYTAYANGAGNGQGGSDYVYDAFKFARETDPDVILYYNDYNLDYAAKADAVVALVKSVNDRWIAEGNTGLLIQGVGMQGHYTAQTSASNVETSIKKFIELGVELSITELDVTTAATDGKITDAGEKAQAVTYAQLFQVFRKYAEHITRVTIWGIDDASSWRASQAPLLFNKDLTAKAAYSAVIDPDKYLAETSKPNTTKLANVKGGTPAIDGDIDAVWEWDATTQDDAPIAIASMLQAWDVPTGSFKLLWDADNLYVLAQVRAPIADDLNGIEVFLDEGGEKSDTYDANDRWYSVNTSNTLTSSGSLDGVESAVKVDGGKYNVELKIPFQNKEHKGADILGFDIRVTNAGGGAVQGRAVFNDTTGMSESSTAYLGEAMLFGKIDIATPDATPSTAPSASPSAADDKGSFPIWIPIVIGAVIIIGAAVFVVVKKKK